MNSLMLVRTCCLFLLGVTFSAFGQDAIVFPPSSVKKPFVPLRTKSTLKIDGHLNETDWAAAPSHADWVEIEPLQGRTPRQRTNIKALYNDQFLYLAAICSDSLGKKSTRVIDFKRDFSPRTSDYLGFGIDGFRDQRNCMVFTTNPYGVQRDFLSFDANYLDMDWDGLWKVRTTRSDSGWVAEFAIPWKTLRYPKLTDSTQTWGINANRGRRYNNENYAFSAFPRSFNVLRMDYAGIMPSLQPPPPSPNIRIQPYVLFSNDRYQSLEKGMRRETDWKIGGEVKWAITPNTVLDLTANTDFAQADADRQVNNVTRFSVFFPERRQFFLENASLFSSSISQQGDMSGGSMRIQPFFSRRIGLDDAGNPIPLIGGARLVHRSVKQNYGGMFIRQQEEGNTPATNFLVGRYSQNFGQQHRIGGLVTAKQNDLNTNMLGMLDGFFRFDAKNSLNWLASTSYDTQTGQQGVAASAQYFYTTNQWKIWWTQSLITKNYNPEMGFTSRSDVVATTPGIFYYYRGKYLPFKKLLRSYEPSLFGEVYHQASTGRRIETSVAISPFWVLTQSGGFLGHVYTPTYQYLTEPFAPLGVKIAPGAYQYGRHMFFYQTDGSKKLSFFYNGEFGGFFNGRLNTSTYKVQFAPLPHIFLSGQLNRNAFKGVGEAKTTKTVDLWAVEGRFAANPRLQLIGFYQVNTDTKASNYNVRLAWEYQPLSFVYIVFNKRAFQTTDRRELRTFDDHAIVKLSYLKQF